MTVELYVYRATIPKPDGVIDGDTVDCVIRCGLWIAHTRRLRLCLSDGTGMNAPETRGRERLAGLEATDHLIHLLDHYAGPEWELYVKTFRDRTGKYGRLLADLFVERGGVRISLCDRMVEQGHAQRRQY